MRRHGRSAVSSSNGDRLAGTWPSQHTGLAPKGVPCPKWLPTYSLPLPQGASQPQRACPFSTPSKAGGKARQATRMGDGIPDHLSPLPILASQRQGLPTVAWNRADPVLTLDPRVPRGQRSAVGLGAQAQPWLHRCVHEPETPTALSCESSSAKTLWAQRA